MEMGEPCSRNVERVAASPSSSNQSEELEDEVYVGYVGVGHDLRPAPYKPLTVSPHSECSKADIPCQLHSDEPEASNNLQRSVQKNGLISVDAEEPIADDLVHKRILGSSLSPGQFEGRIISLASESNLDSRNHCSLTGKGIPCDSVNDVYSEDLQEAPVDINSLFSKMKLSRCLGLAESVPNNREGRILGVANMRAESNARNISFSLENSLQQGNYVPAKLTSGDDDRAAGYIDGFVKLCPSNSEAASEYSHCGNSSLPDTNQEKLSGTDSERANEAETINEQNSVALQKRNSKVFRTSQTELTTKLPVTAQSGKHHAQRPQSVHKYKNSSQAVAGSANQTLPAKRYYEKALEMSRTQTPPVTKQVWKVKEKVEASKDSSKSPLVELWRRWGKIEPRKDASMSSSKDWRIKEKKQPSEDSYELSSRRRSPNQPRSKRFSCKHYITWDGFQDKSNEKLGHSCSFCNNDLAYPPEPPKLEMGFRNFPDVAILPCGHAFHLLCLSSSMSEEQSKDPPCIICESLS